MAQQKLDIIIFGATGYTGKYTVQEVAKFAKQNSLKFGVAGRRIEALKAVVKEFAPNAGDVPIIVADLKDEESLTKMTAQAKVIINCCGPYRFYGEPVIKACIKTNTDHIDVSGEPQFMETMQLKYNKAAQDAEIYIISACGADSVPCDLGIIATEEKFKGQVNSVESYLRFTKDGNGAILNYGTWESAVYGVAHHRELRDIRSKLYPEKLPEFSPRLKSRGIFHQSAISNGWSMRFFGPDQSVAYRTQRFFFDGYEKRPIQVKTYATFSSLCTTVLLAFMGVIFMLLSSFEVGRNLLLKYPGFFSNGLISREGPKQEALKNTTYSIIFKALGWSEALKEPTDKHTSLPNKEMITKLTYNSNVYDLTCVCSVLAAITILNERQHIPNRGGVLTPGAAFASTSFFKKLCDNGFEFKILSQKESPK